MFALQARIAEFVAFALLLAGLAMLRAKGSQRFEFDFAAGGGKTLDIDIDVDVAVAHGCIIPLHIVPPEASILFTFWQVPRQDCRQRSELPQNVAFRLALFREIRNLGRGC